MSPLRRRLTAVGIAVLGNGLLAVGLAWLGATERPTLPRRAVLRVVTPEPLTARPVPLEVHTVRPTQTARTATTPQLSFQIEPIQIEAVTVDVDLPDVEIGALPLRTVPFPALQPSIGVDLSERTEATVEADSFAPPEKMVPSADGVDTPPRSIQTPAPAYPRRERMRGISGFVSIRFRLDTQGQVSRIEVIRNDGPDAFVRSVENTVRTWRFHPARNDGRAVDVWARKKFRFRPKDQK